MRLIKWNMALFHHVVKTSFLFWEENYVTYVKHVGLHHKILQSLVEECDKIRYEVEDKGKIFVLKPLFTSWTCLVFLSEIQLAKF